MFYQEFHKKDLHGLLSAKGYARMIFPWSFHNKDEFKLATVMLVVMHVWHWPDLTTVESICLENPNFHSLVWSFPHHQLWPEVGTISAAADGTYWSRMDAFIILVRSYYPFLPNFSSQYLGSKVTYVDIVRRLEEYPLFIDVSSVSNLLFVKLSCDV